MTIVHQMPGEDRWHTPKSHRSLQEPAQRRVAADKDEPDVGTGLVGAPECGDVMKLQIKVNPETGVIEDAKFKTFGCGIGHRPLLAGDRVAEGQDGGRGAADQEHDIVNELSLPPVKIHCSVLAEDAIEAAIARLEEEAREKLSGCV